MQTCLICMKRERRGMGFCGGRPGGRVCGRSDRVGGGSLMTPILLWFGINPATAVGTDLLYACITKMGGVWVHHQHKQIDWRITGWLALGSMPAALLTVLVLHGLHLETHYIERLIKLMLGVALMLTAIAILFKTVDFAPTGPHGAAAPGRRAAGESHRADRGDAGRDCHL